MNYWLKLLLVSAPIYIAILVAQRLRYRSKVGENGYGFSSTAEQVAEGFDMKGLVAVVTGATNGLGFETSKVFVARGAHVIVTGRSLSKATKAKTAIEKIMKEKGVKNIDSQITPMELDISDLSSIEEFVENFASLEIPLHILMNNAGIMALPERNLTMNGFEMQMGVNHLGHFHLTNLLTPFLKQSAPSKIISVSSVAHRSANLAFLNSPNLETAYNPITAYGNSKLANILHAAELDSRLSKDGVRAYSLHPGVIDTGLGKHLPEGFVKVMSIFRPILERILLRTVEQGASTQVYAALHTTEFEGGKYFQDCQVKETAYEEVVNDETARKKFWEISENLIANAKR